MTPPDWFTAVDAAVRAFAERAATWDTHPGDLVDVEPDPPVHDVTYRSAIERHIEDYWDTITVLRARGRRLAKAISISPFAITDYDAAKHFDLTELPVSGIDMLEEDLRRLLLQSDCCIVRGGIADIGKCHDVRRLLHPDGDDPATLVEVPRRWLALDIDGLARPVNVPVSDLVACAGIAIAALPSEFHDARAVVQATAGHGYKPGSRLRLWYWLSRPVCGAELKIWLDGARVDHALFSAAQIVYTAAPVFVAGRDPLPTRIVSLRAGAGCVAVPELPEPAPRPQPPPVKPATGLSRYAEVAVDTAARRIANARPGERDKILNRECYGIGQLVGAGAAPKDFALRVLSHAARQWPEFDERHDGRKIERSFTDGLNNPREARYG